MPRRNIAIRFGTGQLEWCGFPSLKKFDAVFSNFDTIPACDDRQADGQTSCDSHATHRAVETAKYKLNLSSLFQHT